MDVFEKAAKTAKNVGDTVLNSARNIGNSIYHTTKEQSEMASLNVQRATLEKRLDAAYAKIGRRYMEYTTNCEGSEPFNVEDIIEEMQPDLEKIVEIEDMIAERERQVKEAAAEKAKKAAEDEYESAKAKLDRAIELDLIDEEEYNSRLAAAQRKLDNFEMIKKIDMQLEIGIITKEEHDEKIKMVLGK